MIRRSVVFPQPDGPTTVTQSPSSAVSDTESRTSRRMPRTSNPLLTALTESAAVGSFIPAFPYSSTILDCSGFRDVLAHGEAADILTAPWPSPVVDKRKV